MADVFISYAREDTPFVRDLQRALAARGREAWVDWQDIPPTAEWLREIYAGIEATNAVVFVLSPDFVASKICNQEVDQAVASKKRLVPIVRRDVDNERVHPALAALNWIYFRGSDDVQAAFTTLLKALDTDLEYDRQSAQLLMRAREWERRNRADAATLRGIELAEAERWLAQGSHKTPSPSWVQIEYITASRKVARRRQRRLLIGVSAALAITVILSVVAFTLYQVAQTNSAEAVARQLAAQSLNYAGKRPDLALLLAVEAYRRDPGSGEAANALLTALEPRSPKTPWSEGFVQDFVHTWASVAFSPDGKELAAGSYNGIITLWDVATRRPIGTPLDTHSGEPIQVIFSPDGRLLAYASTGSGRQRTLHVLDRRSHKYLPLPPQIAGETPDGIAFSPDSKELAVNGCSGYPVISLWNVSTSNVVTLPDTGVSGCGQGIAFSPTGSLVTAGFADGVLMWNTTTGAPLGSLLPTLPDTFTPGIPIPVDSLAFSPDSSRLAVGQCGQPTSQSVSETFCNGGAVQLWNVATSQLAATLTQSSEISSVAFSPDGRELASAGEDNSIIVWDTATHKALYQFAAHTSITNQFINHDITFSPHGDILASASDTDLNISLWNTVTAQPLATPLPEFPDQLPGTTISQVGLNEQIHGAAISPNGKMVAATGCAVGMSGATASSSSQSSVPTAVMWLWNPSSHRQAGEVQAGTNACGEQVAFSPDSTKLALAVQGRTFDAEGNSTNSIRLWQTTSHQFVGKPWAIAGPIDALAFSPDGSMLAGGVCQGNVAGEIWLWNVAAGRADRLAWQGQAGCVKAVAFSPDGTTLAAGICAGGGGNNGSCNPGEIQLWDVVHQRPIGKPITGNLGIIPHVWISPDEKTLAAQVYFQVGSPSDGGTIFWDMATRQETQTLPPSEDTALSGDWSLMATASCPASLSNFCLTYDAATIQLHNLREGHDVGLSLGAPGIGATQSLLFGPDNKTLVSWSSDGGPLLVWDIDPASWAARICKMVGRNLTRDEWNRYLTTQGPYRPTCPALPAAPGT